MKRKVYNFFDNPWVAFPLMIIFNILFFYVMFHYAGKIESHKTITISSIWKN